MQLHLQLFISEPGICVMDERFAETDETSEKDR